MLIQSVSLYFDKKNNVIIFPLWRDDVGLSRNSIKFTKLEAEFVPTELGIEILESLKISKRNEYEDINLNAWKEATGLKTWRAFQNKYESVIVDLVDGENWYLAKYRELKDGSYGLEKGDEEKYSRRYTEPLTAEQLGHIVLEMLAIK